MEKLKNTKKITLATLKSFARRNSEKLFVKELTSFDGMTDCIKPSQQNEFKKTIISDKKGYYKTGIQGIYTVGSSRDYFKIYEDENYFGISVYNSCGESILAVKKEPEFIDFEKEMLPFKDIVLQKMKDNNIPSSGSYSKMQELIIEAVDTCKKLGYDFWVNSTTTGNSVKKTVKELLNI